MSSSSPLPGLARRGQWLRSGSQVLLLILLWYVADRAASMLELPVSGGILGLAMLVVLLLTGLVKPRWIEGGAELILANMLLYFIPLVVSVVQYKDLFETVGIKLFVAIGTGFLAVMLVTALVVEGVCQLIRKQHFRKVLQVRKERALLGGDR